MYILYLQADMTTKKITYINTNDPVSATIANRPLRQLQQETERLQSTFDATEAGNTLIYRDIPCDSAVQVGMPVYWDGSAQCCKPAYLSTELNETTNEYQTGVPADCIGLAYKKNSSYSADILIAGIVDFQELKEYFDGGTGRFYLGSTPGSLSLTPNAQAFPLGVILGTLGPCDSAYRVYINPCYTSNLLQHQHYSVDLKANLWDQAMVDDEDVPEGAYIYNIEQDAELSKLWPPIPISAISATIDWGETYVGGREQTINKEDSLIRVNEKGIYWVGEQDIDTLFEDPKFRITIHFSKVQYSTRNAFVTSLQPDTNQPFKFVDCKGQEAVAGDLYVQFTLKDNQIESTEFNGRTLKQFTDKWESEMVSTVNGIRVIGNANVRSNVDSFQHNNKTYHKGLLDLVLSPYAPDTEISPQIIKVGAAQEREIFNVTYLGLPFDRNSSLRLKFEVPGNYAEATTPCTFALRLQCIAPENGPYPAATITYIRISPVTNPNTNILNYTSPAEIPCTGFSRDVIKGDWFQVQSDPINVTAGDTLIVIVSRAASSEYPTDLAIARINGILNIQRGDN